MVTFNTRTNFLRNFFTVVIPVLVTWYAVSRVAYQILESRPLPMLSSSKPHSKYPSGIPAKFDPEGNVQHFPGNTIIAHLSPSDEIYATMLVLYDKLRDSHLSHLFTLLPPSSWHMTIFDGICDQVRKPGFWPSDLSMDVSLVECNELFTRKLSAFDLQCDPPYLMSAVGWNLKSGISIHVEPQTDEGNTRIRGLRDRLADLLLIRHPKHDTYGFHLSMAYFLRYPTEEEKAELTELLMDHFEGMPKKFELGAPEFCKFEDMFSFQAQFKLGDRM